MTTWVLDTALVSSETDLEAVHQFSIAGLQPMNLPTTRLDICLSCRFRFAVLILQWLVDDRTQLKAQDVSIR
jgi:hypothetical protein